VAGRYRLDRRIGMGAMGVVWQGRDERLNRLVAVKKLLPRPGRPLAETARAVARCLREGRIAARLHHPNVTTVFDVVDEDGVPCLVMEYLPSRSLATAVTEAGSLAPAEVAAIGAQVAAALAAAHAAGIVHRDITPANILLGDDGSVKLTDFGISRAADDATATKTGTVAGTPAYMAPEVALGADPTPASDVFSLGSTLYTAVEGQPPFGRQPNTLALLHAVAGGEIKPPQRSGPLTDVLTALLAADPRARPTASAARELLRGVLTEPGPPPTVVTATPIAAGRSRRPLVAAAALAVPLAAAGIWLMGGHNSVIPAEERAPANGPAPSQTASVDEPVVPVGEPVGLDEKPADVGTSPTATTTTAPESDAPDPAPPVATTAPTTTTDDVQAPSEEQPAPTTTPPPSTEETPSAPGTTVPAD
jgi:serine/threonine protein kinase